MNDLSWIAAVISAVGTIVASVLAYNQYTKNKMTDLKIENLKKAEAEKSTVRNENISKIYGSLWQILHNLDADRVFILQPHPLTKAMYISIGLEVRRNGVEGIKAEIVNWPMQDVPKFSADLAKRDFLYYRNVDANLKDRQACARFSASGCKSLAIQRLSDDRNGWIGSLVCAYTHQTEWTSISFRDEMEKAAESIQYILPEYK